MQSVEGLAKKGDGRFGGERSVEAEHAANAKFLARKHGQKAFEDLHYGASGLAFPGRAGSSKPSAAALCQVLNQAARVRSRPPKAGFRAKKGFDLGCRPVGTTGFAKFELGANQKARFAHHHGRKGVDQGGFKQPPRVASSVLLAGFVQLQKDLDPRIGQSEVQGQTHGDVGLLNAFGQGLQHGHQEAFVAQDHGGLARLVGTPFFEQGAYGLCDSKVPAGRNHLNMLAAGGPVGGRIA